MAGIHTTQVDGQRLTIEEYECANFCPNENASSGWRLSVQDGKAEGWVRQAQVQGNGQYLEGADVADETRLCPLAPAKALQGLRVGPRRKIADA